MYIIIVLIINSGFAFLLVIIMHCACLLIEHSVGFM